MYFKLALRNVKKSYKNYLIYFLTLGFSVCLFYMFNSFQEQEAVLILDGEEQAEVLRSAAILMNALSVFVSIVLAFLILYANNFLIRQRKKEFGLYTLLGMPKQKVSRVLVYETLIIGIASLFSGLIVGVILSQVLVVFTAGLFKVGLNYSFIFSWDSLLFTVFAFTIIFVLVMLFNTFVLNKYKLIDLLNADRKQEKVRIQNVYVSIVIFLLSLVCIGAAYYLALKYGLLAFSLMHIIILLGSVGTVLFFLSLSGFLLKFIQTSKVLYFRKLNMFVLRQINANINSNFLSMSVVCIMLLLSIGALATGLNLNHVLNRSVELSTPYDFSYMRYEEEQQYLIETNERDSFIPLKDDVAFLEEYGLQKDVIKDETFFTLYQADTKISEFSAYVKSEDMKEMFKEMGDHQLEVMKVSEYNQLMNEVGGEPLSLNKNETYFFTNSSFLEEAIQDIVKHKPAISCYGKTLQVINDDFEPYWLGTSVMLSGDLVLVVNDDEIPDTAIPYVSYWNVNLKNSEDIVPFHQQLIQITEDYAEQMDDDGHYPRLYGMGFNGSNRIDVENSSIGMSVIFTYIGLYLGIVFLIASAVILALQQLSQANENKKRYEVLNKIGTEKTMMNQSVFFQLSLYFFVPLLLAIVHSIVGIQVVNSLVVVYGVADLFKTSLMTGGIIILIYGLYFYITYISYKAIVES